MSEGYHKEDRVVHGRHVKVTWFTDENMGPPWKEHADCHGKIREVGRHSSAKWPCERKLSDHYYYDWRAAMKLALKDGWYQGDINTFLKLTWLHKRVPTRKMIAEYAVDRDFKYLRSWCRDEWHWCGIEVQDHETGVEESLWGIESEDPGGYHDEIIGDLAENMWDDVLKALLQGVRAA